jgi:hypothetical protein
VEGVRVIQENTELVRELVAKEVCRSDYLLLRDVIAFLFLHGGLESLPWKSTMKEVYEYVSK